MKRTFAAICLALYAATPSTSLAADEKIVQIKATDQMKFDIKTIEVAPGQKVTVTLTSAGTLPKVAMAHNFVLLKAGTDVSAFATAAMTHQADGYIPPGMKEKVIVSSKMLGPGESDTVSFIAPAAGVYDYICTFPGHCLVGMRGILTVK